MTDLIIGDVVDVKFWTTVDNGGYGILTTTIVDNEVTERGVISAIDSNGVLSITIDGINAEDVKKVNLNKEVS